MVSPQRLSIHDSFFIVQQCRLVESICRQLPRLARQRNDPSFHRLRHKRIRESGEDETGCGLDSPSRVCTGSQQSELRGVLGRGLNVRRLCERVRLKMSHKPTQFDGLRLFQNESREASSNCQAYKRRPGDDMAASYISSCLPT